jgi:hypothetical protein
MKRRFTEEQIIGILKQQESGMKTADVCREHNPPKGHPVPTPFTFGRASSAGSGALWADFGGAAAASTRSRECQAQAHRGRPSVGHRGFEGRCLKKLVNRSAFSARRPAKGRSTGRSTPPRAT